MKKILFCALTAVMILTYQNCSSSHQDEQEPFEIQSAYPYQEKTDYYDSIQLVDVVGNKDGSTGYKFVSSIVFVDSPESDVDIIIRFKDM